MRLQRLLGHLSALMSGRRAAPAAGVVFCYTRTRLGSGRTGRIGHPHALIELYDRNYIHLAAAVTPGASAILCVEFFANGRLVGRDTASPYGVTWNQVAAGTYVLRAIDGGIAFTVDWVDP